jgi:hypothetical protein
MIGNQPLLLGLWVVVIVALRFASSTAVNQDITFAIVEHWAF